jgi:hypothetical protein
MCSDGLKAKQAASAHENEEKLKDEERQRLVHLSLNKPYFIWQVPSLDMSI